MTDWVKKALTRRISVKRGRGSQIIEITPSEKLVLGVKFAMMMIGFLTALEIAHMAFLGKWSSEIFPAISGLIGSVTGVLINQHA